MQNLYDLGMTWNDRLRKARDAAGLSDTDIAEACGVKPPSVHAWMKAKTKNIEAHNLLAVCRLLKVSPFWVIEGEDGEGHFQHGDWLSGAEPISATDVSTLIWLFAQANADERATILKFAAGASKSHFERRRRPGAN